MSARYLQSRVKDEGSDYRIRAIGNWIQGLQ